MSTKWPGWDWGGMVCWGLDVSFMVERNFFNGESFYHVCTDGSHLPWMFRDEEDFLKGVNRIGVCSVLTDVKVVSYVLMDNHVHFVLEGSKPACKEFINKYKHLTGKYIYSRYSIVGHLRGLAASLIPIADLDNLLAVIAYIDRNPIVAGYRLLPTEYPWGTARYLFRGTAPLGVKSIGSMAVIERYSVLGTRVELPHHWQVDGQGMLVPTNFWDAAFVESLFKSPARYLYFLSKKLEGDIDATVSDLSRTFIPDKDLRVIVLKMTHQLFDITDTRLLNISQRLVLARKLRYEYASTVKQISRMLNLNPDILQGYI